MGIQIHALDPVKRAVELVNAGTIGKIDRVDIFSKCDRFTLSRDVQAAGVYAYYRSISSPQDPVVTQGSAQLHLSTVEPHSAHS